MNVNCLNIYRDSPYDSFYDNQGINLKIPVPLNHNYKGYLAYDVSFKDNKGVLHPTIAVHISDGSINPIMYRTAETCLVYNKNFNSIPSKTGTGTFNVPTADLVIVIVNENSKSLSQNILTEIISELKKMPTIINQFCLTLFMKDINSHKDMFAPKEACGGVIVGR